MSSTSYVIRGGEVVRPAGIVRACVLVADGRIRKVGEVSGAEAAGAQVVDARGRLVLPGLVELHVQGAGGSDLFSNDPDAVHNVCRSLAAFGTTAFLATTAVDTARDDQPHIRQIVEAASAQPPGASILGIHLEGPFISPEKRGMIRPSHICKVSRHYYERIGNMCGGWLRMVTIAPEVPGALELIRDMAASGIVPALGHTNATYEETLRGLEAGLRHVTHMMNAMRSFHHREPGAVGAVLMHDEFTMQIITDGVHLHPEVVAWLVRMKGPSRLSIITDGMAATGMPPGRYTYAGVEYSVKDGAARYADGTLVGTACTQLELVRRARQFAGLDLAEAVNMASLYPARILGVDGRKGSIAEGRDADLLISDSKLELESVFVRGAPVATWER
jgi:N-acetylglucosamine-6-phosphate deacetylase